MPTIDVCEGDIYQIDGREWLLDFEQNGRAYLRQIVDGVAYWPGCQMDSVDFWRDVEQAEEARP